MASRIQGRNRQREFYSRNKDDSAYKARQAQRQRERRRQLKVQDSHKNDEIASLRRKVVHYEKAQQKLQDTIDLLHRVWSTSVEGTSLGLHDGDEDAVFDEADQRPSKIDATKAEEFRANALKSKTSSKNATGFDQSAFAALVAFLLPFFRMVTLTGQVRRRSESSAPQTVPYELQVFISIYYLRKYPTFIDMASIFGLPQRCVSDICCHSPAMLQCSPSA